jgi:UDP-N-acetylmuramate dehydrogenase
MIIQANVSLRDKNWFQTGGSARFFAKPTSADEFAAALSYARTHALDSFVLGQGANILISDDGFDGLVIRPQLQHVSITPQENNRVLVTAGAGITMHDLIEWCLDHQILGLEEFSGIPGTIGGSVCMNLHYYQFMLDQFFVAGEIIDAQTGAVSTVDASWFNFGYDQSTLQNKSHYLLGATFQLTHQADALAIAFARGRRVEIIRHRTARYPSKNTCGSFFRNFHDDEVSLVVNGKKIIYVAYYLDKVGIKGTLSVGGAHVSHQHANMLVTSSNATSSDVVNLARVMQEKVYKQFGIIPQPECQLIGFAHYPLLSA